ncbi:MAG: prepilin-type N-terminal cleavage/methylation domain-containing protein [Myxococcales bacterium]|nr:prepilin-type N-terminal cleavage/methylation domain-containing protein [Myxococcales bacterium]
MHPRGSKARRRLARAREGITLVEAMVALTILAIVTTLIWEGYAQTARNKSRVQEDLDRSHAIQAALHRISTELSMAYVSAQLNPNEALQSMRTAFVGEDHGSRDRLDFTSFSHRRLMRNAHESDQNELSYFITEHPDDSSIDVLARRESSRIDDDPRRGGRIQIMVEDVEGLEFEYLDPTSGEWLMTWDTTQGAMQPNRLPSQVKILITVPHHRRRGIKQTFGTRASLPLVWALNHAIYNP